MGKSQRAFGHHLQAQAALAKAYQQMPEKVDIIIEYVLACLENHDLTTAYRVLKPAIKSFPDSYLLKKQWVHFLLLSDKADLALKQLDIIKNKHPEDVDMQRYRHLAKQRTSKQLLS